jgi:hypothetical protein
MLQTVVSYQQFEQTFSAVNYLCAFIYRIERLQDFAGRFPQDTSVKNAQTRSASPCKRQQKSVNDDRNNSSKMVSNATLYFFVQHNAVITHII